MFAFLIKKTFFDMWDNFLPAILLNLGFVVVLAIPLVAPQIVAAAGTGWGLATLVAGVLAVFVYLGGAMGVLHHVVHYRSLEWAMFPAAVRTHLPIALAAGTVFILHLILLSVAIPVYSTMGTMVGLFALAVLFWMSIIWWLSMQYILPLRTHTTGGIVRIFKKSFILALDNILFTLALAAGFLVIVGLSFITAFLIPGIAGIAIWYQAAVKLRMYKYDYLEENPGASRRAIPWDALLYNDRDRVGKRTLREMIFPWKV